MKAKYCNLRVLLLLFFLLPIRLLLSAQPGPCCPSDCAYGPDLVVNGHFSGTCLGGYGSDLTSFPCTATTFASNSYTERDDANNVNPAWTGIEHTGDGGRGLIVDGPSTGAPRVWFETVNVELGKTYCFTAWFLNICPNCPTTPTFDVRIDGQILTTVGLVHDGQWVRACLQYTATASGPVELAILMRGASGGGNDAMIDDISFVELQTNCCCKDIKVQALLVSKEPNLCCLTLTITAPPDCDLSGLLVDAPFSQKIVAWPDKLSFPITIGPFCLPKPAHFVTRLTFLDKCGKVVCIKPIDLFCIELIPPGGGGGPIGTGKTGADDVKTGPVEIYPNPATGNIVLKIGNGGKPASGQVEIMDATGRVVQQRRVSIPPENITIDISALKAGSYFIRYTDVSGWQRRAAFIKG